MVYLSLILHIMTFLLVMYLFLSYKINRIFIKCKMNVSLYLLIICLINLIWGGGDNILSIHTYSTDEHLLLYIVIIIYVTLLFFLYNAEKKLKLWCSVIIRCK